ncbi:hypothetical protein J2W35_004154 [Variovorax boronicumulans]|uniref:hypothetical protein n=1 Tax=Variovorax boronicumulans TaxID=436515 RepID=UPI00278B0282|nr:hypothetical protein [Variovorax boronicumulans]MDQ0083788.1 hypothetical protein [Variovorax boronicumulans]
MSITSKIARGSFAEARHELEALRLTEFDGIDFAIADLPCACLAIAPSLNISSPILWRIRRND